MGRPVHRRNPARYPAARRLDSANALRRYCRLESPACAGFSGDLARVYADGELGGSEATALHIYRWTDAAWELHTLAGGDREAASSRLVVRNITRFSDWIIADDMPTAVILVDLRADYQGTAGGLTWRTVSGAPALLWAPACLSRMRRRLFQRS